MVTYAKYANMIGNHILPQLGEIRVNRLTTEVVERFIRHMLTSGRKDGQGGLSEKTVKDMLTVLKEICRYASGLDLVVPCRFEMIKIRHYENEVAVLAIEDQRKLEKFLLNDDSLEKTGILLSLCMGLRLGEVCALKKADILYGDRVLQVRFTMQRVQNFEKDGGRKTKIIVTEPKSTCSVRDIPIPSFLMDRLAVLGDAADCAYILTGRCDGFIEPRTMENIFGRYLKECRMEHIKYHALRHTFATRCIEQGFDVKTLSEILGHANVNITLNRYVHSSMEQKRKWMDEVTVGA